MGWLVSSSRPFGALLSRINYIVMLNLVQHLTNLALYLLLGKIPKQVRDDIFNFFCHCEKIFDFRGSPFLFNCQVRFGLLRCARNDIKLVVSLTNPIHLPLQ